MVGLSFIIGASIGGARLACIETNRTYQKRITIYRAFSVLGCLLLLTVISNRCPGTFCNIKGIIDSDDLDAWLAWFFLTMGIIGLYTNWITNQSSEGIRSGLEEMEEYEEEIGLVLFRETTDLC